MRRRAAERLLGLARVSNSDETASGEEACDEKCTEVGCVSVRPAFALPRPAETRVRR